MRISEPIKSEWASKMQLDLQKLLSDGPYKEKYRKDMIAWSDKVRQQDYGFFCKSAIENGEPVTTIYNAVHSLHIKHFFIADSEIIIVSDIRRKNDIRYFKEKYDDKVFTIRLTCPDNIRNERGYIYTQDIDDIESECGLDSYDKWDLVLENDNSLDAQQLVDIIINKFSL